MRFPGLKLSHQGLLLIAWHVGGCVGLGVGPGVTWCVGCGLGVGVGDRSAVPYTWHQALASHTRWSLADSPEPVLSVSRLLAVRYSVVCLALALSSMHCHVRSKYW